MELKGQIRSLLLSSFLLRWLFHEGHDYNFLLTMTGNAFTEHICTCKRCFIIVIILERLDP